MKLPSEFFFSIGPIGILRVGRVWSLDVGKVGVYGIGLDWRLIRFRRINDV
jgi:hypothetical protein